MMTYPILDELEDGAMSAAPAVSAAFVQLSDRLLQCIDRKLGYFGGDRFVCFRYEPRGEEVIWRDGHSCGFGTGGWQTFMEEIEPLTHRYGVDIGSDRSAGEHVLLIDRRGGCAYFAERDTGEMLVRRQMMVA